MFGYKKRRKRLEDEFPLEPWMEKSKFIMWSRKWTPGWMYESHMKLRHKENMERAEKALSKLFENSRKTLMRATGIQQVLEEQKKQAMALHSIYWPTVTSSGAMMLLEDTHPAKRSRSMKEIQEAINLIEEMEADMQKAQMLITNEEGRVTHASFACRCVHCRHQFMLFYVHDGVITAHTTEGVATVNQLHSTLTLGVIYWCPECGQANAREIRDMEMAEPHALPPLTPEQLMSKYPQVRSVPKPSLANGGMITEIPEEMM